MLSFLFTLALIALAAYLTLTCLFPHAGEHPVVRGVFAALAFLFGTGSLWLTVLLAALAIVFRARLAAFLTRHGITRERLARR